ncbi:MAG: TetR/AcrR family transcriptional regulator [Campylobacterota bacterium]|nr:TetR/AcrR family transcriptional regulator [Campylobacterota bacterium]
MSKKINKQLKDIKKELILKEVSKYFEKVTYEHTKIADISKDLDIAVGTIYKLFTSKENLYYEYLMYQINNFYKELLERQTSNAKENIKLFIKLKYSYYTQKRKAVESNILTDPLFFHKIYTGKENPMNNVYEFLEDNFKIYLEDDLQNYKQLAICFNRLSDGFIESWIAQNFDLMDEIDTIFNMFFGGIQNVK